MHVGNLNEVFGCFKAANLKLKPSKCALFQEEVTFLGHVVNKEGISCDPEKLQAIRDWPIPRNVRDVCSFLGIASYYRKFITGFSTIAAAMTNLTRKGVKFV